MRMMIDGGGGGGSRDVHGVNEKSFNTLSRCPKIPFLIISFISFSFTFVSFHFKTKTLKKKSKLRWAEKKG